MKKGEAFSYGVVVALIIGILMIIFLGTLIYDSIKKGEIMLGPEEGGKAYNNQYWAQDTRDENGMIRSSVSINGSQPVKYSGYIIEFTDDPIIKKKVELELV